MFYVINEINVYFSWGHMTERRGENKGDEKERERKRKLRGRDVYFCTL
jgi:hypothetical protein